MGGSRSQRKVGQHGLSTTCAGILLKQQIPIRTFKEWNETQPGLTFSGTGAPTVTPTERRFPLYTQTPPHNLFPCHKQTFSSFLSPFFIFFPIFCGFLFF